MEEKVNKVKNEIESFLKDNVEHQDKHIDYIMIDPNTKETFTFASDGLEKMIMLKEKERGYSDIPEWDFNFDDYIFYQLEQDLKIGFISDETHYNIWNSLKELYPEDINNKDGVQKYLQFCADNGITKEYLDSANKLDTPDIMQHFEGLALFETMEYKGYVIEADDTNLDNSKENLVNIYENKEDYEKKEPIETVSFNTIGLKQNVRDYIDEFYVDKTVIDKDKAYFTFVLGYDLLNDMLSKSSMPENDISYDFCSRIADKFMNSQEYKNLNHSAYEMLEQWVNDRKDLIQQEYSDFIGLENPNKTRMLDNGIFVLDLGYRNNQPVALVERHFDNTKEYIIAFNYKITDNKIDWAYGNYYGTDISKAKNDFDKVLKGGNLADTFENKKHDKER